MFLTINILDREQFIKLPIVNNKPKYQQQTEYLVKGVFRTADDCVTVEMRIDFSIIIFIV